VCTYRSVRTDQNELANRRFNNPIVRLEVCAEQSVVSRMVEFTCLLFTGLLRKRLRDTVTCVLGPARDHRIRIFRRLMGPEMHRVP